MKTSEEQIQNIIDDADKAFDKHGFSNNPVYPVHPVKIKAFWLRRSWTV